MIYELPHQANLALSFIKTTIDWTVQWKLGDKDKYPTPVYIRRSGIDWVAWAALQDMYQWDEQQIVNLTIAVLELQRKEPPVPQYQDKEELYTKGEQHAKSILPFLNMNVGYRMIDALSITFAELAGFGDSASYMGGFRNVMLDYLDANKTKVLEAPKAEQEI